MHITPWNLVRKNSQVTKKIADTGFIILLVFLVGCCLAVISSWALRLLESEWAWMVTELCALAFIGACLYGFMQIGIAWESGLSSPTIERLRVKTLRLVMKIVETVLILTVAIFVGRCLGPITTWASPYEFGYLVTLICGCAYLAGSLYAMARICMVWESLSPLPTP